MSLKRLTAFIVLTELVALGVFFAALLGYATTNGGRVTIDMTLFGELWPEYGLMLVLIATAPYAMYIIAGPATPPPETESE